MTINFFGVSGKNQYECFSNFYPASFHLYGREWPTVEHAFQAAKFPDNEQAMDAIQFAETPKRAKQLGGPHGGLGTLRPDWDTYRVNVMRECVRAKFDQNDEIRAVLLSTGDERLAEASPFDSFWGVGRNKQGKNMLGVLLMELRADLLKTQ